MAKLAEEFHGALQMSLSAPFSLTFWFSIAGIATAFIFISFMPRWSDILKRRFSWIYYILVNKYGFDEFNQTVFVHGGRDLGQAFYDVSDKKLIDGVVVNGSGRAVRRFAEVARRMQTGYIYHYAFAMIIGVLFLLVWFVGA